MALDDMYSEHVPPGAFVTEAQQLLDDSLAVNAALRQALTEHDWCDRRSRSSRPRWRYLRVPSDCRCTANHPRDPDPQISCSGCRTGEDDQRTALETELGERTEASADLQTVLTVATSSQGARQS